MQTKRKVGRGEDCERFDEDICDGLVANQMGVELVPVHRRENFSPALGRMTNRSGMRLAFQIELINELHETRRDSCSSVHTGNRKR